MALLSTEVLPDNTLEEFRIEFNKLVTDVSGLSLGNTFDTQIIFEGATDDTFETALSVTDPTADRSIVFPNQSGNVLLDSANISFADNIELQFGAGPDLKIFHNGSNSIIRDNGTGALFLEGDTVSIRDEASSETMANFVSDGAVTLYHNNAVKLATASGGIAVTGEVAATSLDISGDVDIDGTLETDALSIASTTVTSTAAELNILDGVTSTAAELNILDGVTSTAAELNILDGVTSTAAELNLVDGITAGTVAASKAVIVDSNKDITGYRNLTSTGTITGAEVTATSDIRLKSNIETIDSALDKVKEMRGVYFDKHGSQDKRSVGVIAQEMQEIMPEVVVTDDTEDKYLSVAYGNLVGVLIEAVKELSEEVDKLKKSIRTVEFKDSK